MPDYRYKSRRRAGAGVPNLKAQDRWRWQTPRQISRPMDQRDAEELGPERPPKRKLKGAIERGKGLGPQTPGPKVSRPMDQRDSPDLGAEQPKAKSKAARYASFREKMEMVKRKREARRKKTRAKVKANRSRRKTDQERFDETYERVVGRKMRRGSK